MTSFLIVDDSRTSRRMLRNILESNGYKVVGEGVNGEDGVKKAEELKPDVILLDITMPIMDGLTALKHIREDNPNAVVVMVSAAGQKEKIIEAVKLGASEFVVKPYEEKKLVDVLRRILG